MDWKDVTTQQLLVELTNRYHHLGFVGQPKDANDATWSMAGNKASVDDLMATFIANEITVTSIGRPGKMQFNDVPVPSPKVPVDQRAEPLIRALGRLFSVMIVAAYARDELASESPVILAMPNPHRATKAQLMRIDNLRNQVAAMPVPGV